MRSGVSYVRLVDGGAVRASSLRGHAVAVSSDIGANKAQVVPRVCCAYLVQHVVLCCVRLWFSRHPALFPARQR